MGSIDHAGLVVQQLAAFRALHADDVGDIGLEDDGAAIGGALLADLKPTVAGQPDIEDLPGPVQAHAFGSPGLDRHVFGKGQHRGTADDFNIVGKGNARKEFRANVGEVPTEAGIAQHEDVGGVEKGETFIDRLDGLGQVASRPLGRAVGVVELLQRGFEVARALAHPVLQNGGPAELLEGSPPVAGILLDMADEGIGDVEHLFEVFRLAIGGVEQSFGQTCVHGSLPERIVPGG